MLGKGLAQPPLRNAARDFGPCAGRITWTPDGIAYGDQVFHA
ncbi:hypothetical protein [Actinoplanes sp. NPDC048796]